MSDTTRRAVFSAFADARTGNRGAVSMLESAIDHLTAGRDGTMNVFTVYPRADRKLPPTPHVHLHSGTPLALAGRLIPLSLLYALGRRLGLKLPGRLLGRSMRALLDTDVCLMIGGTTFNDSMLFKVPYNVACLLPAILLGKKAILYSQTLGPFRSRLNRVLARWCLSRMDVVVPRGEGSLQCVRELNLPCHVEQFADAAFSLVTPEPVRQAVQARYGPLLAGNKVVGISVNSIVEGKCRSAGIDHTGAWRRFLEHLRRQGYFVLMIPHSMRKKGRTRHNNDLLTIAEILSGLGDHDGIHVADEPMDCKELRFLVGMADYYVASRFHSMISALCCQVPVLVFGWGHQKYREVMGEFELEAYCHDAAELSAEALMAGFARLVQDAEDIKDRIRRHLPAVRQSSQKNHESAWRLSIAARQGCPPVPAR